MLTSKKFILTKRNVYHILSRKRHCILLQHTLLSFFHIKITLLFLQIFAAIILFLLRTLHIRIVIYMPVTAVFHTCATHVIKKHIGGEDKNSDQIPFGY